MLSPSQESEILGRQGWESEILERLESDILPPTLQPRWQQSDCLAVYALSPLVGGLYYRL